MTGESRRLVLLKSHPVRIEGGGFGDSSSTKQDLVNQYEDSQVTMSSISCWERGFPPSSGCIALTLS